MLFYSNVFNRKALSFRKFSFICNLYNSFHFEGKGGVFPYCTWYWYMLYGLADDVKDNKPQNFLNTEALLILLSTYTDQP